MRLLSAPTHQRLCDGVPCTGRSGTAWLRYEAGEARRRAQHSRSAERARPPAPMAAEALEPLLPPVDEEECAGGA